MNIRKTTIDDLDTVLEIYAEGRKYMRENGNLEQWQDGYPQKDVITADIENEVSFVVTDDDDNIICVFAFIPGPDVTYTKIYEGN